MNLQEVVGMAVTEPLASFGSVSEGLRELVVRNLLTQLDSKTIIEAGPPTRGSPIQSSMSFSDDVTAAIEDAEQRLEHAAPLGDTLQPLLATFGRVLRGLIGPGAAQSPQGVGERSAFLMTDVGGASIADWQSTCSREGDLLRLRIRKQWAIGGHEFDNAVVLVRGESTQYPVTIQLHATDCRQLAKTAIGRPFLSGRIQLGNVSGDLTVAMEQVMARRATIGIKVFLSIIRPRFARAVIAHLRWLHNSGQLPMTDQEHGYVEELEVLASAMPTTTFAMSHLLAATAVKLATNEMLHAVVLRRLPDFDDHSRDLLGLAKMEGSSYRCLHELLAYQGMIR